MTISKARKKTEVIGYRLSSGLVKQIRKEAEKRRITLTSVIEAALKDYFDPEIQEKNFVMIARAIQETKYKVEAMDSDIRVLSEAMNVFVQAWLTHTPPLLESQKPDAVREGKKRYQTYVDRISENVRKKETLYEALQHREFLKKGQMEVVKEEEGEDGDE